MVIMAVVAGRGLLLRCSNPCNANLAALKSIWPRGIALGTLVDLRYGVEGTLSDSSKDAAALEPSSEEA